VLQRENRRKRSRKLRRGVEEWEKKIKDNVENAEGKRLVEWIEENGWEELNGNKQRDEERGETVIDYGIVNEEA
jgi:uncharacterized protein YeeX (DUF496 family)